MMKLENCNKKGFSEKEDEQRSQFTNGSPGVCRVQMVNDFDEEASVIIDSQGNFC